MQTYRDHGLVLRGLRHGGSRFASSVFVEGMSLASQLLLFSQASAAYPPYTCAYV